MANNTTNVTIRMDAGLKASADEFLEEMGMSLSTAVNVFIRQMLRERRIPFSIGEERPNRATWEALLEAERIAGDPSVKGYTDVDELFADLAK